MDSLRRGQLLAVSFLIFFSFGNQLIIVLRVGPSIRNSSHFLCPFSNLTQSRGFRYCCLPVDSPSVSLISARALSIGLISAVPS